MLKKLKLNTLRVKFPVITFFTYMILILVILAACYNRFYNNMVSTYKSLSDEILGLESDDIVIDNIPGYLRGDYNKLEYDRTLKKLNKYI